MSCIRKFCTSVIKRKPYYATTPIYYVNAEPHLGHLYSSLLADVAVRWRRMREGEEYAAVLMSGTDEHGTKVSLAAARAGCTPQQYCDRVSTSYRKLSNTFEVSCDRWVRTTDAKHTQTISWLWRRLSERGHIFTSDYKGWYCVADETFLCEGQLHEIKPGVLVSADSGQPVEWCEERNYVFRAGEAVQENVRAWLKDGRVSPPEMQRLAERLLEDDGAGRDVSISRPVSRVPWGVRVPDDPDHTVYVWLDALCSYLTAAIGDDATNCWPADLHVLGKDILRFHAVLWPAVLFAAGLEPPRHLHAHAHWTQDHIKMSKSLGNVVDPFVESEVLTADGLRYFLLREAVPHTDANYSREKARRMLNAELADTLGNLLSRCCARSVNPHQIRPARPSGSCTALTDDELQLRDMLDQLPHVCEGHYNGMEVRRVVDDIVAVLHRANACVEAARPWRLASSNTLEDGERLLDVLGLALEVVRTCTLLLYPIVPRIANIALDRIGVSRDCRYWQHACEHPWNTLEKEHTPLDTQNTAVLFKKIPAPKDTHQSMKRAKVKSVRG